MSNSTVANPTFKIPPNGTSACASGTGATNCPTYKVVVTKTNTAKSSASVTLASYASTLPTTPVANAGANQNAPNGGGVVTLNASASAQAQGHSLSYQWTQTAGPAVTLSDPTAQMPTFTAPPGGSTSTQYTFSLVVKDTQNVLTSGSNTNTSTAATTNVFVVPDHVVATATGTPASTVAGTTVTLDGSASTDPNLAPLTYAWTQVSNGAPTVTLSDPTAAKPTFVAPRPRRRVGTSRSST